MRSLFISRLIAVGVAAMSFVPPDAAAQDLKVFPLRYDHTQEPTSIQEHLSTPEARAVIGAAGSYFGVPRAATAATLALISYSIPPRGGQTRRFAVRIPDGYEHCVTLQGPRTSQSDRGKFALFLDRSEHILEWNSYAQKEGGLTKGRNWVNRDFDVVFVMSSRRHLYRCTDLPRNKLGESMIFEQFTKKDGGLQVDATVRSW